MRAILAGHYMDIAGDVEEHAILKQNETILVGGKVTELEDGLFHLEVFGVKQDVRGTGAGIMHPGMVGEPWKHSLSPGSELKKYEYKKTIVAWREVVNLYQKAGFAPYSFAGLAWLL